MSHHRSSFGGAFTFNSSSLPTVAVILNMYENRYACYAFLEVEADHRRRYVLVVCFISKCSGELHIIFQLGISNAIGPSQTHPLSCYGKCFLG